MGRRTSKEIAIDKLVTAKAKLHTQIAKKRLEIFNKYDALNPAVSTNRRTVSTKTKNPQQEINTKDRLTSINLGRDLLQNSAPANALITTFKNLVIGTDAGKIKAHTDNPERNKEIEAWWSHFCKNCDSRKDHNLRGLLDTVLEAIFSDGDSLLVWDLLGDKKLLVISADQLTEVKPDQWATEKTWVETKPERQLDGSYKTVKTPLKQYQGVLHNRYGIAKAFCFTSESGLKQADRGQVTIVSADNALLVKSPNTKSGQLRGVPELLKTAPLLADIKQLISLELESAKLASSLSAVVKHATPEDAVDSMYNVADDTGASTDIDSLIASLTDELGLADTSNPSQTYPDIEAMATHFDYLGKDDSVEVLDHNRPNPDLENFVIWLTTQIGIAHGICKSLITGEVTKSYAGYRGELVQSWQTITRWQKSIETVLDWIASKAIESAFKSKEITRPPKGWQYALSWQFPEMPVADPRHEVTAKTNAIKAGLTTYQETIGTDWDNKLTQLAKEVKRAKELELPLAIFETQSGAIIEEPQEEIIKEEDN